ncbi:Oidioi.mRNA.OKI2018_I69.chr1.g1713.t1.cds [Oikopleura dioica]|uniref:Oidioi.mRNA.OKI2018_I69.chr1.g1713.t1.cds n=1 Tax=Oikopleura dioica TaxID=34765 RepID=A0ABN7SVQ4_OIKDI|nr:Oidioi.mRNA.OKI2018_I69.chr1.g1713.t1.cds [Oikopleura dioica]
MLRMVDDNSAPFRNSSRRIQSHSLQLLLFETSVTEKNALEGAPDRLGWIWDSKKAKQADGKRRMFIKNRKLVFEPPLETISGTYEIPDWVEEEDKKSREKKSARGTNQKKGKKKKQNKKLNKRPSTQQHDVQDKLSSSQAECSSSRDTELELDNGDVADLVTEDNEDRPSNEEPSNEMASLAEDLDGTHLEEEECPEPEVEKNTRAKSVDKKTLQRERLEAFMMCQICYEYYDDGKRAKYSHACGHCCCWTCMKMEFARQRNIGRKKFYCHCGFEIHEKKIIRMFA